MSVPPPWQRILPNMEISEQGLRELEIWLLGRLKFAGDGGLLYNDGSYGPENTGDWLHVTSTDTGSSFKVGGTQGLLGTFSIGLTGAGSVGIGAAGANSDLWLTADNTVQVRGVLLDAEFDDESIMEFGGLTLNTGPYLQGQMDSLTFDVRGNTTIGNDTSGGNIVFSLASGQALRVERTGNEVVYAVNEDSSQVVSLRAGKTYVINDHLASPLVTYTG